MHKYKKIRVTKKLKNKFEGRFEKVSNNDCWEWKGTRQAAGYGVMRWKLGFKKYTMYTAHRLSFAINKNEKLKDGMVIDHICRNRGCVNPNHLRQIGIRENALRDNFIYRNKIIKKNYSIPTMLFSGFCYNKHQITCFDDLYEYDEKIQHKDGFVTRYKCKKCIKGRIRNR